MSNTAALAVNDDEENVHEFRAKEHASISEMASSTGRLGTMNIPQADYLAV